MSQQVGTGGLVLGRRAFLRLAGIGAAGAWLGSVAGCGGTSNAGSGGAAGDLTFFWWGQGTVSQRHLKVVTSYEHAHPGVHVNTQYVNSPAYPSKLSTEIAGGNPPSIFEVAIETQEDYLAKGAIRKLNDLVPSVLPFDKLPATLQQYCKYKGDWYLIPTGIATKPAVVYNKSAFERLGIQAPTRDWTLDELATTAKQVYQASGGKLYGIVDLSGNDWALSPYMRGLGKNLFDANGKLGFTKDDLQSWFQYWADMRKANGSSSMDLTVASKGGKQQANDEVIKNQAAMTLQSSSKGLLGLQKLTKDELGLLPFPKHSAGGPTATVVRPIEWWVLSSKLDSATAKQAADLCLYTINNPQALTELDLAHGVPLFTDTREQMASKQSGLKKLIYDDAQAGLAENPPPEFPYPPGAPDLLNSLESVAEQIGYGKTSIGDGVNSWFAQAARTLGS